MVGHQHRKSIENPVPKLICSKQKRMERRFSASHNHSVIRSFTINQNKKHTAQFKRDIAEAICQSNQIDCVTSVTTLPTASNATSECTIIPILINLINI